MANELLEQKKKRMIKAFRREKTDKVLFYLLAKPYIPTYLGIDLRNITSYDYAVEIHKKVMDDLQPDVSNIYSPENLVLAPTLSLLRGGAHVVSEDCVKQINPAATCIMSAEEYPALIKDPVNYLLETVYPRRYKLLENDNFKERYTNISTILEEGKKAGDYTKKCVEASQTPTLSSKSFFAPVDIILDLLRNFTGIMNDIRRCPEYVRDAGLAMVDDMVSALVSSPAEPQASLVCPMHLPPFVKPKDFEKVYWPSFKKLVDALAEQGYNIGCMFEKNYTHLYDYLQELPKQHIAGIFEEDDIRVVKSRLGNQMTIFGGLSLNILSFAAKQECIDHVKALIDDVGRDPGFCITPDKPMYSLRDAKPENIKAVSDTILTYGMN